MPCELEEENPSSVPGMTLLSKSKPLSPCQKKLTSVYLPPKHRKESTTLNVILWLHGFYVRGSQFLFKSDPSSLRETILKSGKDVVLVAPWLGDKETRDDGVDLSDDVGGAKWAEGYLDDVLKALAPFHTSSSLKISKLVIACHSGGGKVMRKLVETLGSHQSELQECWGFDCLYGPTDKSGNSIFSSHDDPANSWYNWVKGADGRPLYIFYGPSTLAQSVKLDLLARGIATPEGNKADPPGPQIKNVHVIHSHYEAYAVGQAVVDAAVDSILSEPSATPPRASAGKPATSRDGEFVKQAANKIRAAYAFPDDIHYRIAKYFFLTQLRNASFL